MTNLKQRKAFILLASQDLKVLYKLYTLSQISQKSFILSYQYMKAYDYQLLSIAHLKAFSQTFKMIFKITYHFKYTFFLSLYLTKKSKSSYSIQKTLRNRGFYITLYYLIYIGKGDKFSEKGFTNKKVKKNEFILYTVLILTNLYFKREKTFQNLLFKLFYNPFNLSFNSFFSPLPRSRIL